MINQEQASKLWKVLLTPKMSRLIEEILSKATQRDQLLLLKICYRIEPSLHEQLVRSPDVRISEFCSEIWSHVLSDDFAEERRILGNIVDWYVRIGLAERIWRAI